MGRIEWQVFHVCYPSLSRQGSKQEISINHLAIELRAGWTVSHASPKKAQNCSIGITKILYRYVCVGGRSKKAQRVHGNLLKEMMLLAAGVLLQLTAAERSVPAGIHQQPSDCQ